MSDAILSRMSLAVDAARTHQGAKAGARAASTDPQNLEQVRKAAEEFEAFFIAQMMQPMFATVETDETFGGGVGEDAWRGMLVDQYGKEIAHKGGIGIADQVMKAMLQAQEEGR